jgi:hypothetical protein
MVGNSKGDEKRASCRNTQTCRQSPREYDAISVIGGDTRSSVSLLEKMILLHDLVLCQASSLGFHCISTSTRGLILDVAQTKWATTILVARELLDSGFGILGGIKSNNASTAGSTVRLILDFGLLDLSDSGEKLDKILVAR